MLAGFGFVFFGSLVGLDVAADRWRSGGRALWAMTALAPPLALPPSWSADLLTVRLLATAQAKSAMATGVLLAGVPTMIAVGRAWLALCYLLVAIAAIALLVGPRQCSSVRRWCATSRSPASSWRSPRRRLAAPAARLPGRRTPRPGQHHRDGNLASVGMPCRTSMSSSPRPGTRQAMRAAAGTVDHGEPAGGPRRDRPSATWSQALDLQVLDEVALAIDRLLAASEIRPPRPRSPSRRCGDPPARQADGPGAATALVFGSAGGRQGAGTRCSFRYGGMVLTAPAPSCWRGFSPGRSPAWPACCSRFRRRWRRPGAVGRLVGGGAAIAVAVAPWLDRAVDRRRARSGRSGPSPPSSGALAQPRGAGATFKCCRCWLGAAGSVPARRASATKPQPAPWAPPRPRLVGAGEVGHCYRPLASAAKPPRGAGSLILYIVADDGGVGVPAPGVTAERLCSL